MPGAFALSVAAFIAKTKINADEAVRGTAFELLAGVVEKSPVDTGFFRGNWRVGINEPDMSVASKGVVEPKQKHASGAKSVLYSSKAAAAAAAAGAPQKQPAAKRKYEKRLAKLAGSAAQVEAAGGAKITEAGLGDTIHITNNTEYGEALENGHSGQAPLGMVKITFEEVKVKLETLIKQAGE